MKGERPMARRAHKANDNTSGMSEQELTNLIAMLEAAKEGSAFAGLQLNQGKDGLILTMRVSADKDPTTVADDSTGEQLLDEGGHDLNPDETARLKQLLTDESVQQRLITKLLEASRKQLAPKLPQVPSAFNGDNQACILSTPEVMTVLEAYSAGNQPQKWTPSTNQYPTYTRKWASGDVSLQLRPNHAVSASEAEIAALWEQVQALGDEDGDIFLLMLAQALIGEREPGKRGVWITSASILDDRGVEPMRKREGGTTRRAGHRQADIERVGKGFARQQSQHIVIRRDIRESDTPKRKGSKAKTTSKRWYESDKPLWIVYETLRQHELPASGLPPAAAPATAPALPAAADTSGPMSTPPNATTSPPPASSTIVAVRYDPGEWITPFLDKPNRTLAYLCQQTVRYDPYHERWEKRLARYLMFQTRMNAQKSGSVLFCRVGTLLETLSLPIDDDHPIQARKRLERAFDRMVEDGHIAAWAYADSSELPKRNWFETWRARSIRVMALGSGVPAEPPAVLGNGKGSVSPKTLQSPK